MYIASMYHPESEMRKKIYSDVKKSIELLEELGAEVLVTHPAYETPGKPLDDLWSDFVTAYSELVDFAGKHNVKLAVETSRHRHVKCIVYNVPTYKRLFKEIPSRNVGINLDPSQNVWMGIDNIRFVKVFGDRIYGFHAKDTEVLHNILNDYGIVDGYKMVWWRFRVPGWGEINWRELITALVDAGFKYDVMVEAEDPIFSLEEAQARAAAFLKPLLSQTR